MAATTAAPPSDATNVELVRWAFDALNRGDLAAVRTLWTDATVERFPDRTCRGADEIAAYFAEALAAIDDWNMDVRSVVAGGDDVFVHWHLTGTHNGRLLGIEPTGKPLAIDGIDHFVVRDGKVVSNFVVFDQMQYAQQLGMMPPTDSGGDKAFKAAFNARTKLARRLRRS